MFVNVTLEANTASACLLSGRYRMKRKKIADDIIPHVLVLSSPSSVLNSTNVSFPSGFKWDNKTTQLSLSPVCLGGLFSLERNCTELNSARHCTDWPPDNGVENKNLLHYFLMKHPDRNICPWCDHSISSRNWTVRTWLDLGPVFVWEEHEDWAAEWSLDIYVKDLGFHQKGVEWVTRSPWQRGPLQCRAWGECGL